MSGSHKLDDIIALIQEYDEIGMSKSATINEVLKRAQHDPSWELASVVMTLCSFFPQQQKVIVAQAQAMDPKIMIPDPMTSCQPTKTPPKVQKDLAQELPPEIKELLGIYASLPHSFWDVVLKSARQYQQAAQVLEKL